MHITDFIKAKAILGLQSAADVASAVTTALASLGSPAAFTSRALTSADNGKNLIATTATATVNTGLPSNFGVSFKGTVTFDGTATVTDVRTSGASAPWCALVATGTDTYDAVGSKT